jgi:hypothetical protein
MKHMLVAYESPIASAARERESDDETDTSPLGTRTPKL